MQERRQQTNIPKVLKEKKLGQLEFYSLQNIFDKVKIKMTPVIQEF